MFSLKLSTSSLLHFHNALTTTPFLLSSFSKLTTKTPNPLLHHFLINQLHFPPSTALSIASNPRYPNIDSLQKPQALVQYFQNLGFSLNQIQSSVQSYPRILFMNLDKIIKPKVEFFQRLGFHNSHLGKYFSKNSSILASSLEKQLIPVVQLLRKVLVNDRDNKGLLNVLHGCSWLLQKNIESKILPKIKFLENCGIVGDQLAMLLRRQPRLFSWDEAVLRNLVSRASDLGFQTNSRMFARALFYVSCCSDETLKGKVRTFERLGFSKDEYLLMIRKEPSLLTISTKKWIIGFDFYLNTAKLTKEVLIQEPVLLMYSLENRVMPRCRVLEVIKCKQLLKKQPAISKVMRMREEVFLERFISKFADHEEELLKSYNGHTSVSSRKEELSMS